MASMLDSSCTCEQWWRGQGERPACTVHELPAGTARRARVLASLPDLTSRTADDDHGIRDWRPWP
jgi:hypothetical protein